MFLGLVPLFLATVPDALCQMIHERMSADQVGEIFQTIHNSVPDYEVVQFHVSRMNKRDTETKPDSLIAKAFGDEIELWLKPTEGVLAGQSTPVFTARKNPRSEEIVYREIPGAMKNVGKLLEDPATRASLIVKIDARGQYVVDGFIGSKNLVVRSLPESISYDLMQNRSSDASNISENSGTTRSAYHVVFKREERDSSEIHKSIRLADQRLQFFKSSAVPYSLNRIPEVIYPEIMVVVDYNLFTLTGRSIERVLMYVLAFWNGVDLLYRSFEEPKFRFNIARVVIAQEQQATPYISQNMYNDEFIDAYKAHEAAQQYYYSILNVFPADSYDAIMTLTGLQMTSGKGVPDTLGVALTSGACYVDNRGKTVWSIGITYDDGTFQGVATAAHEFAHLLGAGHDDKDDCASSAGYIMAPAAGITDNSHDFSQCTVKEIDKFLSENYGICFYNKPRVTDPLPIEFLPGHLSGRDHQCKMMTRGKDCYTGKSWQLPCTAVYCYHPQYSSRCFEYMSQAPPDGAFCAEGKVCLHGKCLRL